MILSSKELRTMSVLWRSGEPMTSEDIALALYLDKQKARYVRRVGKQLHSLMKKNAIKLSPEFTQEGGLHFAPTVTAEEVIAAFMEKYNKPRRRSLLLAAIDYIKRLITKDG